MYSFICADAGRLNYFLCNTHAWTPYRCAPNAGRSGMNSLQRTPKYPQPHVPPLTPALCHFQSHNRGRPSDVIADSPPPRPCRIHTARLYLPIPPNPTPTAQQRCRCFCRNANELAHLAVQTSAARPTHAGKLHSLVNASMLFQFAPVNRLYRNNYWDK